MPPTLGLLSRADMGKARPGSSRAGMQCGGTGQPLWPGRSQPCCQACLQPSSSSSPLELGGWRVRHGALGCQTKHSFWELLPGLVPSVTSWQEPLGTQASPWPRVLGQTATTDTVLNAASPALLRCAGEGLGCQPQPLACSLPGHSCRTGTAAAAFPAQSSGFFLLAAIPGALSQAQRARQRSSGSAACSVCWCFAGVSIET